LSTASSALLVVAAVLAGAYLISFVVEALRRAPQPPDPLQWDASLSPDWVSVDGIRLRYVVAGDGPPLVLLHTLRTHLDLFQKVIPQLRKSFRVYALDYPGHGFSDIPNAEYDRELFYRSVAGFLDTLGIRDAVVVGESIGGTIGLLLAARGHPGVAKVVAVNSYDYGRGRGIHRGSALSLVLFSAMDVPVLGEMLQRYRSFPLFRLVMRGSVHRFDSIPPAYLREMNDVGNRPGHYRAFLSLVRHFFEWEDARSEYGRIGVPVLLLYGEADWSRPPERHANQRLVPGAALEVVPRAGHLLCLDAPEDWLKAVESFARA
jgi:pimeloyl-ACP methyl ester carboxylesterase